MPQIFTPIQSTNLSTPDGTYIYHLVPLGAANTAAISSTDTLHIFNASTLQLLSTIPDTHAGGVTCLKALDNNVLLTAGRDGMVKLWDARSGGMSEKFSSRGKPFLSLAISSEYGVVAAGEELADHLASVIIWDMRTSAVLRHYTESHSDDVTELQFDTFSNSILLSGSTDGLLNVYDLKQSKKSTRDADDDEALLQVINHGSSIHHTGFLRAAAPHLEDLSIYGLSHDEILTIYPFHNSASNDNDSLKGDEEKCLWGDVRQKLGCEYVLDLVPESGAGRGGTLVVGSCQQQWLDLIPFKKDWDGQVGKGRVSEWKLDSDTGIRLAGAHDNEVVRCIHVVPETRTVFTGGEDGLVKVWKGPHLEPVGMDKETPEKNQLVKVKRETDKKKHSKKNRRRPY